MHYWTAVTLAWTALCAISAQAADSASKHEAPPPAFTWAGFHIGVNTGVGIPVASGGRLEAGSGFTSNAFDLYAPNRDRAGPSIGAQVGYDWQIGQWVYGFETDFNFLGLRRSTTGLFPAPAIYWPSGAPAFGVVSDENGNYSASVRARLGFAIDRSLFYVTGGVAAGGWRGASALSYFPPATGGIFYAPVSQSSRMKYALGAGVEYALHDQWSARLEYLYLNQALQTRLYDNGLAFQYAARQRSEAHVLRLGLNYRFGPNEEARGDSGQDQTASRDQNGREKNDKEKRENEKSENARDNGDRLHLTDSGDETKKDAAATDDKNGDEKSGSRATASEKGEKKNAKADENKKKDESKDTDASSNAALELYSFHGQTTGVLQGYPKFPALYTGRNSLPPEGEARTGATSNLFLGLRLWEGGAAYLNPEIDVGYGLGNSTGVASYVNGAVAKVGRAAPYMRFQRYFLRQIIGLGGDATTNDPETGSYNEVLESTQNQLSGKVDKNRITLTIGKFAVPDVFDDNKYAHDPTTGFLNFGVNTLGAFDYAADAWGYTYGAAVEWKQNWWTARAGVFQLSDIPNSQKIEPVLGRQFMGVAEFEARYDLFGQPGVIKLLAYADNGYIAKVDDVVNYALLTGNLPPDVDNNALRKRHVKTGGGINIQQQITPELGFFLRASMADGRFETVDYTDIDRSLSTGLVAAGELWGRSKDEIGGAVVFSGLSGPRTRYFGLGGTSVYIGDGALSYAGEKVVETYYKYALRDGIDLTLDYQFIGNPAHNAARGPINVFGLRVHAQF